MLPVFSIAGWFTLIAALPALCGIGVHLFMHRWGRGYMVCASCAYPCTCLETWRCPECGCDVRLTGLSPVGRGLRRTIAVVAWLWANVLLFFAVFGMPTIIRCLPTIESQTVSANFGGGRSDAFTNVNMIGRIDTYHAWFSPTPELKAFTWTATFSKDGAVVATLDVDEVHGLATFTMGQQQIRMETVPELTQLAEWFRSMISPGWDQVLQDELAIVLGTAWQWRPWYAASSAATTAPPPPTLQVFSSRGSGSAGCRVLTVPTAVHAAYASVGLIGAVGILCILLTGRRRLRVLIVRQFHAADLFSHGS